MNRMDGEHNENVYGRLDIARKGEGISCRVIEMVKCSTLCTRVGADVMMKE